eukprot:705793-Prymnesium_polylepis.1
MQVERREADVELGEIGAWPREVGQPEPQELDETGKLQVGERQRAQLGPCQLWELHHQVLEEHRQRNAQQTQVGQCNVGPGGQSRPRNARQLGLQLPEQIREADHRDAKAAQRHVWQLGPRHGREVHLQQQPQ